LLFYEEYLLYGLYDASGKSLLFFQDSVMYSRTNGSGVSPTLPALRVNKTKLY
jgi:hypothetical protein